MRKGGNGVDQKKIGAFLKELRGEKHLTQKQFAEILGVTNRSISRWENGLNMPDFDLVIEIAKYFSRRICGLFIAAILAFILYSVLNFTGLDTRNGYEQIASCAMGFVGGVLLVGALYTSGYMAKIKAFKKRLLLWR